MTVGTSPASVFDTAYRRSRMTPRKLPQRSTPACKPRDDRPPSRWGRSDLKCSPSTWSAPFFGIPDSRSRPA
jgi:hypothetical protein